MKAYRSTDDGQTWSEEADPVLIRVRAAPYRYIAAFIVDPASY